MRQELAVLGTVGQSDWNRLPLDYADYPHLKHIAVLLQVDGCMRDRGHLGTVCGLQLTSMWKNVLLQKQHYLLLNGYSMLQEGILRGCLIMRKGI